MGKERGGGNNVVRSERKGEERERETRWCGREREREEGTRWCEERERGVQGGVNIKRRGQGGVSREREKRMTRW